ncbi:MAG: GMC oxidoreductase [Burkholderiaceae bacterium]
MPSSIPATWPPSRNCSSCSRRAATGRGRVYEQDTFPAATCGFTQQRPESVGHIRITPRPIRWRCRSSSPITCRPMRISRSRCGMRLARQFLRTAPMLKLFEREEVPGDDAQSDEQLLSSRSARATPATTWWAPARWARARTRWRWSTQLRVHGLAGLRVIDASVMPRVTSSNTCAATLMIAEKGADLVLQAAKADAG